MLWFNQSHYVSPRNNSHTIIYDDEYVSTVKHNPAMKTLHMNFYPKGQLLLLALRMKCCWYYKRAVNDDILAYKESANGYSLPF